MTTSHILSRLLLSAAIATGTVVAVGCGSSTAPSTTMAAQVQRPHYEEDDPMWNCQLDGDRKCGHVLACWTEHKRGSSLPADARAERLCGYADGAGAGSDGWVFGDFMHDAVIR
jgi:major membrane immunogen (membrane-anchored lipoprotein)